MSTGKIVGIVAAVILVLFVCIGVCMVRSGADSPADVTPTQQLKTPLELTQDKVADLTAQVDQLTEKLTALELELKVLKSKVK